MTAKQIHIALARLGDPDIAAHSMRFFKSGKGEYGVGGRSFFVSVHRAPHLLCCRALEVQKYVCAPDVLHLQHPVNAYN